MKLYIQTADGQVFIRNTPNDYEYASVGRLKDTDNPMPWFVCSWHRRIDLATKAIGGMAANNPHARYDFVPVSRKPLHGPCARCDGTGKYKCAKCHGKHHGDTILYGYKRDADGNSMRGPDGYLIRENRVTGHWTCTCPEDGLVKCNVCKGKGKI